MTRARIEHTRTNGHAPPGDTTATVPAGIAGSERHAARKGLRNTGQHKEGVRTRSARRGMRVRHATRAAAVAMVAATTTGMVSMDRAGAATAAANAVKSYSGAIGVGPTPGTPFHAAMTGIAATPTRHGYWLAAADGGVFSFGDARFAGSAGAIPLARPVVGLAAEPIGTGYWLVASDGGVFSYGSAHFHGSAAPYRPFAPIVGIAATPTGHGYWLVGADGGVFSFGDAHFHGSAEPFHPTAPIVGIASSPTGRGYWLLSADGGVFAFGDAPYRGSLFGYAPGNDAVGITASDHGYLVARRTGAVASFGTPFAGTSDLANWTSGPTVGIAASAAGYWTVQGAAIVNHMDAFLTCTRSHESSHTAPAFDNGYQAVNPSHTYFGAYQFDQRTWNSAASVAGRADLIGVNPAGASVTDQDLLAMTLFQERGAAPWMGRCAGLS
ncbi:MAG TPA: hypothetical protein VGO03_20320 [Acidimicrobiia bacterium]|jgi:hypothetical protein